MKTTSENRQSQETENNDPEAESDNANCDSESTIIIQQTCQHCEASNLYHTAVMKCPKCFWDDNRETCPVCSHNIIPLDWKQMKVEIKRCFDCEAVTHFNRKKSKETFYPPEEGDD